MNDDQEQCLGRFEKITIAGIFVVILMFIYQYYPPSANECYVGERWREEKMPWEKHSWAGPYTEQHNIHLERVFDMRLGAIINNSLFPDYLKSFYVEDDWEGSIKAYEVIKEQRKQERDKELKNDEENKQKEWEKRYRIYMAAQETSKAIDRIKTYYEGETYELRE